MMISETQNEQIETLTADFPTEKEQLARADAIAKQHNRRCTIAALAVSAGAAVLTALLSAFPATRAAVVPVPLKYAKRLTSGMVLAIDWKMLFFAGVILLITAIVLRRIYEKRIEEETVLHTVPGTDTEANREACRKAVNMRRSTFMTWFVAAAITLFCLPSIIGEGNPLGVLVLAVPVLLICRHIQGLKNNPLPETPAASASARIARSNTVLTACAAAAAVVCGIMMLAGFWNRIWANRNRTALNATAKDVHTAIASWWNDSVEQGNMPAPLPQDTGNLRGDDTDPDSLTQKIYPYFTYITSIRYYRVICSESGSITDVLISQSPITDTSTPTAEEQCMLLGSPFTDELAVGSWRASWSDDDD